MFQSILLSVYALKTIISAGIVVTLLIGVILLYVLVYAYIIISITAQFQTTLRDNLTIVFLTASLLLIFSSLGGIYGLIRKMHKCLVMYAFTIFIYFVVFLFLAIFLQLEPGQLSKICTGDHPSDFQLTIQQANKTLCKSNKCHFTNQNAYNQSRKGKNILERQILKNMGFTNITQNSSYPANAENCESWSNTTYPLTQQIIILQSFFNCSGWCPVNPQYNLYYLFTNVNDGIPQNTCVDALIIFYKSFGLILEISSFLVALILLFILTNIICLCCHTDRGNQYDAIYFFRQSLMTNSQQQI